MATPRLTEQDNNAIDNFVLQFMQHYGSGYKVATAPRDVIRNTDALVALCARLVKSTVLCELFCDQLSMLINTTNTGNNRLIVTVAGHDTLQGLQLPTGTLIIMIYPNYAIHTASVDEFKKSCHETRLFKIDAPGISFFPFDPDSIM